MLGTGIGIGIGPFGGGNSLTQRLSSLFPSGRNGALYDPSDMASLYQDVGKTTPVTVVTNPVGSVSDKSGVYGSGALTQITTAVASGTNPIGVAVDPTGRFVYTANNSASTVSMYSINQTTGALTSIGAAVASGTNPYGVAVDPSGRFVYVANNSASTVSMYSINQTTGALTSIGAAVASGAGPQGIAVDPLGKFVYVANNSAASVSMYSINQTTGELTSIGAAIACGNTPIGVAVDPTGKFVYVTNTGANTISMYSINQTTGMLTSIGAAVASGAGPGMVAVDPTGRFVYVPNYIDSTVSMYLINQTTGVLTSIGAAVASGTNPISVAVDPTGRFVYVANRMANTVSMYSVNQTTGELTSIGAVVTSGDYPYAVAVDPTGRFVYVTSWSTVSMYFIQRINYLTQATAAARPTWSNRVNLLTYTEQFDSGVWVKDQATVTTNNIAAPDGTLTADRLVENSATSLHRSYQNVVTEATNYTFSIFVKAGERSWVKVSMYSIGAYFDLVNGVVGTVDVGGTASIADAGNGWWRCSITSPTIGGLNYLLCEMATGNGVISYTGDSVSGLYIWGGQLESGTSLSNYQRVTTATNFDTAGFPYYLSFLGTDDSLSSATGGGGSSVFFWCGAVQPTGGAGTYRALFDNQQGAGSNGYLLMLTSTNKLDFYAGNGAAFTNKASTATVDVGTKYVLTAWDDGVNLNVQIGDGVVETVARPVVASGGSSYSIGKWHLSSDAFFIGNLYASVYFRDTAGTAADRAIAQDYCRLMGGM